MLNLLPFPFVILSIFFAIVATFVSPFLSLAGLINPVAILVPHDCATNTIVNITGNFSVNSKEWALIPLNGLCPTIKGGYSVITLNPPEGNSTRFSLGSNVTQAYNVVMPLRSGGHGSSSGSSSSGSHKSSSHSSTRSSYRSSSVSRSSPFIIPGAVGRREMNLNRIDFRNCVPFHRKTQMWAQIDRDNHLSGQTTNLLEGGRVWGQCRLLMLVATVSLFTGGLLAAISIRFNKNILISWGVNVAISLLIFLSFLLWIIVLCQIRDTDQLDPVSWSTSHFYPCAVSIYMSTSTDFAISLLVFNGCFVTLALIILSIACYYFLPTRGHDASGAAVGPAPIPIAEEDGRERRKFPLPGTLYPIPSWSRQRRYSKEGVIPNMSL